LLLVFIGSKVFMAEAVGWEKFPPEWSLGVTFAILGAGIAMSMWKSVTPKKPVERDAIQSPVAE